MKNRAAIFSFILISLTLTVAQAGDLTLRPDGDTNSRLEIKDAVIHGDETEILFWTWADRGDPEFKTQCSDNFYTVRLQAGLPATQPRPAAHGLCAARGLAQAGLTRDGVARIMTVGHLEDWHDGERLSRTAYSSLDDVAPLLADTRNLGNQFIEFNEAGDLVMLVMLDGYNRGQWPDASGVLASLDADNEKRWLLELEGGDATVVPERIWAGSGGEALLYFSRTSHGAMVPDPEPQLLFVSAAGKPSAIELARMAEPFDIESIRPNNMEDMQRFNEYQANNQSESIKQLSARPDDRGGYHVLFERKSLDDARSGHFLLAVDGSGQAGRERSLGSLLANHGLDRWYDFEFIDGKLRLLSTYSVRQSGVNTNLKTWLQMIVSTIDLDSLQVDARLLPIDRRYLEAAMKAGDAGRQHLEALPGSTPVLLTSLDDSPLAVGQRWKGKKWNIGLYEAGSDLPAFTEAWDKKQAKIAKQEASERRKAEREARKAQMNQAMQSDTGMTMDEFKQLDDQQKAQAMMQGGNMDAMMAEIMRQAQAMQGQMTPEQQAQMQAQMEQVQQMMQGGGMSGMPGAPPQSAPTPEKASFTIDPMLRGHVQYNGNGAPVTLLLINRDNGDELMQKEFADGKIDEYVSLRRYQLPTDRIGAQIKAADGRMLADLEPE